MYSTWDKIELVVIGGVIIGVLGYGGSHLVGKLKSNRGNIDLNKSFNIAIEDTKNTVSVVYIKNYTDFKGDTVEFETQDGLRILTSIVNTSLLKEDSFKDLYEYAKLLARGNEDKIVLYDKLQGNNFETSGAWNKRLANFDYNFDKAIEMLEDGSIVVYDIKSWRDYEDDDKLQIITKDDRVWLTHYKNVRLIDTSKAMNGALENYIYSLTGNIDNISYYDENVKKLNKTL